MTRQATLPAEVVTFDIQAWGWFTGLGAALAVLGVIASANLILATMAATFAAGAAMFAGGILQLAHALAVRRWNWATIWTLSGLLYLGAAASLLYDPWFAAGLLTLILGVTLGAAGLARGIVAVGWRGSGWGWMLASSLVSIALAVLIMLGWPGDALWVLGFVLAVDLIVQGIALTLVGLMLRARPVGG